MWICFVFKKKKLVSNVASTAEPRTVNWKNNLFIDFLRDRLACVVCVWVRIVFIHGDVSLKVWTV